MKKFLAVVCVISWSGFWAFGYLALSAGAQDRDRMVIAMALAAAGMFTGLFTYLKLARITDPGRWRHVRQQEG